jgi:hypothetical protein
MVANTTTTKPATVVPATVAARPAAPTQYVAVLVANPKKPNSASFARFACYAQAGTVAAYKAAVTAQHGAAQAKICAADLLYDQRHAYVTLHATAAQAQAAVAAQPKPKA